jgi:hypothetical protein
MSPVASERLVFIGGLLLDLFSKEDLARLVSGGLRDVIKMHGPVTIQNVDIASTRLTGNLVDEFIRLGKAACADVGLRLEIERLTRDLAKCRKQRARIMQRRHDLLALLKTHNISPGEVGSDAED